MSNPKTAVSLRLLSLFLLPLLACSLVQAATPTHVSRTATQTSKPTRTIPAQLARRTSLLLTRAAKQTQAFPTTTSHPLIALPTKTPTISPTPGEFFFGPVTPTPTFSMAELFPRAKYVTIPAPALSNNLLGELPERELLVYLPLSYYDETQKRYPVVYYLLDFGVLSIPPDIRPGDIEADIHMGHTKEMMIVVVNGVNSLGGSFYVNSPVTGNWGDFVARDVVGYVDANYRTLPKPASRGIGGHAMGATGALNLAMRHPDVFGAVYGISPTLFDDHGLAESQMFSLPTTISDFVDLQARELLMPVDEAVTDMKHYTGDLQFSLAYGAAFAPNPQTGPPYVDYPYYRQNGRLFRNETTWKRWEAGFGALPDKIQIYKENLSKLNGIGIDYGVHDQNHWIPRSSEYFSAQLNEAGISNQLVSFSGDPQANSLEQRIRDFMLPFFSQKLVFDH